MVDFVLKTTQKMYTPGSLIELFSAASFYSRIFVMYCCVVTQKYWLKTKISIIIISLGSDWAQLSSSHSGFLEKLESVGGRVWNYVEPMLGLEELVSP